MSRYALDCMKYIYEGALTNWVVSLLRLWLNDEFYKSAFTEGEQARIVLSNVTSVSLLNRRARPVPFQNVNAPIKHQPPFFVKAAGDFFMSFFSILQTFTVQIRI